MAITRIGREIDLEGKWIHLKHWANWSLRVSLLGRLERKAGDPGR